MVSVGKSFSIDSVTNGIGNASFDTCKQEKVDTVPQSLPKPVNKPQISVDIESPVNEFEMNCDQQFPKLMAKSVSEEVLNNMEGMNENMQTLTVTNHDEMSGDNLSSSSTSSLVILSKKSADPTKLNGIDMNQPLLTPEELGPNDAFMLFLCLTIMLQNRDRIMDAGMDRNDIQMFFDNMIRKHSVHSALNDARHLFHTYLSQWHKEYLHKWWYLLDETFPDSSTYLNYDPQLETLIMLYTYDKSYQSSHLPFLSTPRCFPPVLPIRPLLRVLLVNENLMYCECKSDKGIVKLLIYTQWPIGTSTPFFVSPDLNWSLQVFCYSFPFPPLLYSTLETVNFLVFALNSFQSSCL